MVVPAGASTETIPMGFDVPGTGPTYVPKTVPVPAAGSPAVAVHPPSAPIPVVKAPVSDTIPVPAPTGPSGLSVPSPLPLPSPLLEPAVERDFAQPPVHLVTTPPPPHVDAPALPPVMVAMDTPPPILAARPAPAFEPPHYSQAAYEPPPPAQASRAPTFILHEPAARHRNPAVLWITIASAVIGGTLGILLVVALKRHPTASAATPPAASSQTTPSAAPATSLGAAVPPPPSSGSASGPAAPSSEGATRPASTVTPTAHFPGIAAKASLDVASHEITHCHKGKVWGTASAFVTFSNDGTVSHVTVGVPFTGTPTGACVGDALSSAHVPPFAGHPVVLNYKFFVPMK